MTKKDVHTCIDSDLWKEAQLKDITWSNALETGIKLIANSTSKIPEMQEEIKQKKLEIRYLEKKIEEEEKKEDAQKKEEEGKVIFRTTDPKRW